MFVADRLLAKKKQIASIKQILGLKAFTMLRGGGGKAKPPSCFFSWFLFPFFFFN